ncbi:Arm DNA-binding domain-containing protein [uncultured Gilliamella sp.]|uniref:Arm DNA-binding domain-containing protein n=1 Tax=uncultured Gilliamella sp. TaxID=1193505 RepID=UPI0025FBB64E|nr:Arm DNA-binding domain-containing protein [uncultured Gilliamella sp.]
MAVLTDYKIKAAKSKAKEYTLKDGNRLFLNIHPNGSKYWLFRFSWNGKQSRLSFGTYPTVDIKKHDPCVSKQIANYSMEFILACKKV